MVTEAMEQVASVVSVPLHEVTAEVRFPGDARVPMWRGELQRRIHAEYPHLHVPFAKDGEAPAMQAYRFANEAGTKFVDVAIHSIGVVSREYPGWENYRAEVLKFWSILREALDVRRITRLGLRYVNRFNDLPRLSPGHRGLYAVLDDAPRFHRSVTAIDTDDAQLIVNLEIPEIGRPVTVDFDACRRELGAEEVEAVLDRLHGIVEREFASVAGADLASGLGIEEGK